MHISVVNGCISYLVTIIKYPKRSNLWEEGLFGLRVQEGTARHGREGMVAEA